MATNMATLISLAGAVHSAVIGDYGCSEVVMCVKGVIIGCLEVIMGVQR